MDEYKQYYYEARPSAIGKAFGRWVPPNPACLPPLMFAEPRKYKVGATEQPTLDCLPSNQVLALLGSLGSGRECVARTKLVQDPRPTNFRETDEKFLHEG